MHDTASAPAAAMDTIYRRQRYIYDATRRYYLFGRDQMIAGLEPPPGGSVLEIGCGTARNLLQAACLYPDAEFYGFDISEEMLKTAKRSVEASPFHDSIHLSVGDARAFDTRTLFHLFAPDRIFISYALSMIPGWETVIERAAHALACHGELHIVDFGRMDTMPSPARRALLAWLRRFSVTPRRDLERVCRDIGERNDLYVDVRNGAGGYWTAVVLRRF